MTPAGEIPQEVWDAWRSADPWPPRISEWYRRVCKQILADLGKLSGTSGELGLAASPRSERCAKN